MLGCNRLFWLLVFHAIIPVDFRVPADFICCTFHSGSFRIILTLTVCSPVSECLGDTRPALVILIALTRAGHELDKMPRSASILKTHTVPWSVGCYCISFSDDLLSFWSLPSIVWALEIHQKDTAPALQQDHVTITTKSRLSRSSFRFCVCYCLTVGP